jgi:hypothetical protein
VEEFRNGHQKKWFTAFQHPPSSRLPSSLKSYDVTRQRDKKDRPNILPAQFALIRYSRRPSRHLLPCDDRSLPASQAGLQSIRRRPQQCCRLAR